VIFAYDKKNIVPVSAGTIKCLLTTFKPLNLGLSYTCLQKKRARFSIEFLYPFAIADQFSYIVNEVCLCNALAGSILQVYE